MDGWREEEGNNEGWTGNDRVWCLLVVDVIKMWTMEKTDDGQEGAGIKLSDDGGKSSKL